MTGLAHRRILITRAPRQASELADRLRELGAVPIVIPTIEIAPPTSWASLDSAVASLADFDIVVFTSANAVEAFQQRATAASIRPAPRCIAVVGPATARAVQAIGLHPDVLPPTFTAESLTETLRSEAAGRSYLLVLAETAPTTLRDGLTTAGADVTIAAAYRNRIPESSLGEITSLFSEPKNYPDAVTFTSASTAFNLVTLLDAAGLVLPELVVRASIGPVTSRAMRELGIPPDVEAVESSLAGLVGALAVHFEVPKD